MELTIGIVIVIIVVIFIITSSNKSISKNKSNPEAITATESKIDYVKEAEERIASSNQLLSKIRDEKKNEAIIKDKDFKNERLFTITGIHVGGRKNYILDYLTDFDEINLKHEVNNQYSDRAIVVKHGKKKIGYIPEKEVERIHQILIKPHVSRIYEIEEQGDFVSVTGCIRY
jgi:hypothetical protein